MGGSDSNALVREVLDRAITEVAEAQYGSLALEVRSWDLQKWVDEALDSLAGLQQGVPPDYRDEMVALFYLAWYQPRQIHLAYAALRDHVLRLDPPQQVIDYGCGAGAVQVALAILITDLAAEKPELRSPAVHGIDPSQPMRQIGKAVWGKFREIVHERSREIVHEKSEHIFLERLRRNMDSMSDSCSTHATYGAYAASRAAQTISASDDCWFTAAHAVYDSNRESMKSVIGSIRKDQKPTLEVVTFYQSGVGGLPSFFGRLGFLKTTTKAVWSEGFSTSFPTLDSWRSQLALKLPGLEKAGLLTKRFVEWDPGQRIARGEDVVMIRSGAK